MDLEVLDFDALLHIFGQDLNDCLFVSFQPDKSLIPFDFLSSDEQVLAPAEVCLKMMSRTGHIVKLDESGFFLVKGVNLQIMLMKDDTVSPVVLENVRINFIEQNLS